MSRAHGTCHAFQSKINPKLWIGNQKAASDRMFLKSQNIKTVFNVTEYDFYEQHGDIVYYQFNLRHANDPNDIREFLRYIQKVVELIQDSLKYGSVLIHSKDGYQRAPSVYTAYLLHKQKCELGEALDQTKQLNDNVFKPNVLFLEALVKMCTPTKPSTPSRQKNEIFIGPLPPCDDKK